MGVSESAVSKHGIAWNFWALGSVSETILLDFIKVVGERGAQAWRFIFIHQHTPGAGSVPGTSQHAVAKNSRSCLPTLEPS